MALVEVKPLTLMQGSLDEDGEANAAPQFFMVRLDAKPSSFADVLAQAGANVPARGATDAAGRKCTKRNVARWPSAALTEYVVECTFETVSGFEENPLSRKDDISFDIDGETESFFIDNSDTPKRVLNTNGERFETLPERTTGGVKLVIEGNRSTFNAAQAVAYTRPSGTNDAAFTVRGVNIGAGQAKMTGMSGKPTTEGAYTFWRVKWELALAPDWKLKIENVGYTEYDAASDDIWPILRGTPPEPITSPWPLNEDGTAKANQTDEPFVIEFEPYPKKPFGVFNWTAGF